MSLPSLPSPPEGRIWSEVREEVREVVWLVSVVGALSVASVALAVALAAGVT